MGIDQLEVVFCTGLVLSLATASAAQDGLQVYAGGVAGVSTLSADARSIVSTDELAVSLYKPETGPALNLLLGVHLGEYVTVQANYIWNRNALTLVSARTAAAADVFYEQPRTSSQHAIVGDLLVYVRARRSRIQPYLSAGAGAVRFESLSDGTAIVRGAAPPPSTFAATRATLRVAVGMDVAIQRGWSVRYSFSESISGNPVSEQLAPAGECGLANFQNLLGLIRTF